MNKRQWYAQLKGRTVGPMSSGQLRDRVRAGEVTLETPIRKGDSRWTRAGAVEGLFSISSPAQHVCPFCGSDVEAPPTNCPNCHQHLPTAYTHKDLEGPPRPVKRNGFLRRLFGRGE